MAEAKYDKYFFTGPVIERNFAPGMRMFSRENFGEYNLSLLWNYISQPFLMEKIPHHHDFDQFLFFYGGNPNNINDFGATVELSLEGEKHIINTTTVVHIPQGLIHCPLHFTKVDRPIIFMNVALTPEYGRKQIIPTNSPTISK